MSRLSDFKLNYFANTTYFKLSECDDVSIINIIQVKFSCFLCSIFLYAKLQGWGGKLSRPVYLAPHPPGHQSKSIVPILLILNYLNVKMYRSKT